MLTERFIQQMYLKGMNLYLHPDELQMNISNDLRDYLNTDIVFHSQRLLPIMQFMLDNIPGNRQLRARCRLSERILTLWILGLDALATANGNPVLLPRTCPESSGRVDCLLPGEPSALLDLSDDDFIKLTAQEGRHPDDHIPRAQLIPTMRHWERFMEWLSRSLAHTGERCLVQLATLQRCCDEEERVVRRFDTSTGFITIRLRGAGNVPPDESADSVDDPIDHVARICRGDILPVTLEARVHYHNGAVLTRFMEHRLVADTHRLTAMDYGQLIRQALAWLRSERQRFHHHVVSPAPALRLVA